jgi:uncharacterized protein YlxP (DUF503 family)
MHVGVLVIEIMIYSSNSLKEKRFVLNSIRDRVKKKFNVSISELDFQDKWQRSQIGIATISNEYSHTEKSLQKVFQFLDRSDDYEIISYDYNYF